ncbi:MAG: pilus assembly protein [Deltaproteobacteria bacterium]|nr:pilus assembly protein [Deltaproteobacteria bacterium]
MARPKQQRRSLLRDTQGHATTETVIMLPVFILIWGFITWASHVFEAQLDLVSTTRDHAWQHAMNDCNGGVGGGTDLRRAPDTDLGPVSDVLGAVDAVVGLFPGFGEYWPGVDFEEHQYQREGVVPAPEVTGAPDQRTAHRLVLLCNEDHETPDLEEMSNNAFGVFGGGL